ncbi:SGNH/GDSL hydrolase family protein [Silanimonas sp.]|uniref:SGNH/GDSL hydrolase family protein n=1 Tax=Silanimonas sp. TaxID=1929290 RepID=UPI0022BEEB6E|nr:SGNH/GDSL hydrolase family protein [Silanimonas sp.]MCZ8114809.1 SGNH/GDSL hydrolase family protein [Silanimonas sp.]
MLWKRALFWGLMPLAAPQGLRLKRTAPRFAPAPGPREGRVGDGPPLHLLAIGDSVIDGVGCPSIEYALTGHFSRELAQVFEREVRWRALGRTGACVRELGETLLPEVPAGPWDLVLVSVGVNDVSGLTRSAAFERRLGELVEGLQSRAPNATVLLCGLPRMQHFPLLPQPLRYAAGLRAQTLDALAAGVAARRPGVLHEPTTYVPRPDEFAPDGYHANAATQGAWAAVLARRLAARWQPALGEATLHVGE